MKTKWNILCGSIVFLIVCAANGYGAGISPGRWTNDVSEYNCSFNADNTYSLIRPSTRYSQFTINDVAGLTGILTGCSVSSGIEYLDGKTLLIDWQSEALSSLASITASAHFQSPDSWDCPAVPGGNWYLANLVCHSDAVQSGSGIVAITAAVSQIALYRNYALKADISGLQEVYSLGETTQFQADVKDYLVSAGRLYWFDFSYSIDWESDGIIDETLSGIRMTDELGQTDGESVSSGYKYKTLDLEHLYSTPGSYQITLYLADRVETTSYQIPVEVIPEPATLALLSLGGWFLRNRRISIRR